MLRADLGKTADQQGLRFDQRVHLFVEVSGDAVLTGTATHIDAGTSGYTLRQATQLLPAVQ